MSQMFSRECQYALQAVLYLALEPQGSHASIKDLSRALGIPYFFLGKIFQRLTRRGVLSSRKGAAGGFALARPAERITLLEIIDALDGRDSLQGCVLGFPQCSGEHPCAVHGQWQGMQEALVAALGTRSVAAMAQATEKTTFLRARSRQHTETR